MLLIFVIWVITGFRLIVWVNTGLQFPTPTSVCFAVCSHSGKYEGSQILKLGFFFSLILTSAWFFPWFVARLFKWLTQSNQGSNPHSTQPCAALYFPSSQRYQLESLLGESQFAWLWLWVSSLHNVLQQPGTYPICKEDISEVQAALQCPSLASPLKNQLLLQLTQPEEK